MKQNRTDWKAKNYVNEYDAKMKKKRRMESRRNNGQRITQRH